MEQNKIDQPQLSPYRTSIWYGLVSAHSSIIGLSETRQAELSAALSLALALLNLIGGIAAFQQRTLLNLLQVFGTPVIISMIAYFISRTSFYKFGSFLLVAGFCASGFLNIILNNAEIRITVLFYVPIALTIASVLLSSWAIFLLTGLNIGTIFLLPFLGIPLPGNIGGVLGLVTAFGLVLILINNFRQNIEAQRLTQVENVNKELLEIRSNLEKSVTERTRALDRRSSQLEAAAFVARSAAEVHDLTTLLDNVAKQITERFGFYHVGIFLADISNNQVTLVAASSPGGQKMIERGHKLEIGRQGIVGFSAHQKRPRMAQDVGIDSEYFKNPDLPETRSEIALPLLAQNHLIGVLDIQSRDANAFSPDDVYTLQTMTDQIALAIENNKLIEQSRISITNLELSNTENTKTTWNKLLGPSFKGFTYTPLGVFPVSKNLAEAPGLVDGDKTVKIPLNLRGQSIGNILLKRKPAMAAWSDTEKEMAHSIASQVVLALENARLLEESRQRALREQTVNEFSTRFSRSLDIDTLLQNAVREFHRIPQVSEVSIFINPEEETKISGNG